MNARLLVAFGFWAAIVIGQSNPLQPRAWGAFVLGIVLLVWARRPGWIDQ